MYIIDLGGYYNARMGEKGKRNWGEEGKDKKYRKE